ncbi:MAG: formyltransferase family protein [Gemmatimonadaceae bacterium]
MRIVFIGCVEFSYSALEHLLTLPEAEIVAVVTRERSDFNADFRSLRPLAEANGIPYFLWAEDGDSSILEWLSGFNPDVAYCFGWSRLLSSAVLALPRNGIVGFHPTELPMNRGRHPLIWALALGLRETASTFFFMGDAPDSGPILSQVKLAIHEDDDARSLYSRVTNTALKQLTALTRGLADGTMVAVPQDAMRAGYWRRRTPADGRIDWRMSGRSIRNLVRALATPYPGATFLHGGADVIVRKVALAGGAAENLEPGKVLAVEGKTFTVRVGDGALRILDHDLADPPPVGAYL